MKTLGMLFIALLLAGPVHAGVDDLAWMAGDWRGGGDGESAQEVWLKPVNGFMNGISRMFSQGELVMHEHLFLSEQGDDVLYRLEKHLRDASGKITAREPMVMRVVEIGEMRVLFEIVEPNPHAPRLLAYERDGDRMKITVTDPPGEIAEQLGDGTNELVFELRLAADAE